jgi:putative Mg2+ transporter-C (MgtC) family protein
MLVLRNIRAEQVDETDTSVVQVILESPAANPKNPKAIADNLRVFPWIHSVEWTETAAEAE